MNESWSQASNQCLKKIYVSESFWCWACTRGFRQGASLGFRQNGLICWTELELQDQSAWSGIETSRHCGREPAKVHAPGCTWCNERRACEKRKFSLLGGQLMRPLRVTVSPSSLRGVAGAEAFRSQKWAVFQHVGLRKKMGRRTPRCQGRRDFVKSVFFDYVFSCVKAKDKSKYLQ